MKIDYSRWFNGKLYTPGQVGIYQVSTQEPIDDPLEAELYSYWDGNEWRGYSFLREGLDATSFVCNVQHRWFRGLARNPYQSQPTKRPPMNFDLAA